MKNIRSSILCVAAACVFCTIMPSLGMGEPPSRPSDVEESGHVEKVFGLSLLAGKLDRYDKSPKRFSDDVSEWRIDVPQNVS